MVNGQRSMVNGQCSMVIMPSVSILGEVNVLKCHIHKTFLHITLHGNTENRQKIDISSAYQCRFRIQALILTFNMKHLTPPFLPLLDLRTIAANS